MIESDYNLKRQHNSNFMTGHRKQEIRVKCQQQRSHLSLFEQEQAALQITQHILALSAYQQAKIIAFYTAHNGEINLRHLWHHANLQNKQCYFPKIVSKADIIFLPVTRETLWQVNRFNIAEPIGDASQALSAEQFDIIIVPVVAFDKQGNRIGMGGGYYDRYLANQRPHLLLGVAYDFQQQPFIPSDPWDISLQAIVTPQTIYWRESI